MSISASMVMNLREKTGAGMMNCKQALTECNGDFEASVEWLRKKGLSAAAKKAGRITAEGLVAAITSNNIGAVIEVNSETDFVAKNDKFQALVTKVLNNALNSSSLEDLQNKKLENGKLISEEITENIATIGENLNLRRMDILKVKEGIVASYIHNGVTPNMGKIVVLVGLETNAVTAEVKTLAKQIAMHIAATKPESLNIESLDQNMVEKEKKLLTEQAGASGKPAEVIAKMVEGRVRKFYEEVVLMEQIFVIDGKTKIGDLILETSKTIKADLKLTGFIRYELGEGIEQEKTDFAAEVAAAAGQK